MEQISEDQIRNWLSADRELIVYEEIDSTNNAAKQWAQEGAPDGSAVVALRQTAGKGRLGRSFYSPSATGIYMTVILRPSLSLEQSTLVTSAAAVATARAIEKVTGISVQIKWVNDLYLNGKKLCGILAESALLPDGKVNYLVVGIGVNVSTDSFPPELSEIATSLAAAGGEEINCNRLIAAILNEFRQVCAELENREYLEEYKLRSCVLGKSVQLIRGKESQEAFALDVDRDAHLVVRLPNGSIQTIRSGEISLKGDWR